MFKRNYFSYLILATLAATLIVGCSKKAPEIPAPEPIASQVETSVSANLQA
ncbi:MAG: hypothetical protein V4628_15960 [Pseudomonadota bacterium]